jgi:hypothetical protein
MRKSYVEIPDSFCSPPRLALAAQPIATFALDPRQAVDLPVSREITTVMFPARLRRWRERTC